MPLVERYAATRFQPDSTVVPTPYLPIFIVPFRLLLALDPVPGWLAWTALNAAVLGGYFVRIRRALAPAISPPPLALFVALPTFFTLAFGQVNALLLVGFCEFLLALRSSRDTRAGLWLGLMMIKPHMLDPPSARILIQRRWKVLLGVGISATLALVASLILAGTEGIAQLLRLLAGYTGSLASTYPESMMNWRLWCSTFCPASASRPPAGSPSLA